MAIHTVEWQAPSRVKAFYTDRIQGASKGPYFANNLAQHVGDNAHDVIANRQQLNQSLNCSLTWLEQVHSTTAIKLSSEQHSIQAPVADASYSHTSNCGCVVMTADCLPILICDKQATVVSAVHAGWRGLANGILENTLAQIDYPGAQFMAWIGPAIGPKRFEVGAEVKQIFEAANADANLAFESTGGEKYLANLPLLAEQRLNYLGIHSIVKSGLCSYDDSRFYSYRREPTTGRFASLIYLED